MPHMARMCLSDGHQQFTLEGAGWMMWPIKISNEIYVVKLTLLLRRALFTDPLTFDVWQPHYAGAPFVHLH